MRELNNVGWRINMEDTVTETTSTFAGCTPLKHLFGFCEDYKKVFINCNQQLVWNRASTDFDALFVYGERVRQHKDLNQYNFKITLSKVIYKMPIIRVVEKDRLKLLKVVDSWKSLSCAFRSWNLCEYPVLPQNI